MADESCWCCGQSHPNDRMVHLGNHPEVGLCLRCAHFVHKQAWEIEDRDRTGPLPRSRDAFRQVRRQVVERGWHQNPVVGGPLRWLGKHLP
jgi:hypothetical protein